MFILEHFKLSLDQLQNETVIVHLRITNLETPPIFHVCIISSQLKYTFKTKCGNV